MTSSIRLTAYRLLLGAMFLSFAVASCNNKKDKKEEAHTEEVKTEPAPSGGDSITQPVDTLDTRPVKPGE